jgi:hypothetical protein
MKNPSKDISKLSTDKEITSFQKAISESNVSEKQLSNILDNKNNAINSLLDKDISNIKKIDDLLNKNSTNNLIAGLLYTKFKNSTQ